MTKNTEYCKYMTLMVVRYWLPQQSYSATLRSSKCFYLRYKGERLDPKLSQKLVKEIALSTLLSLCSK